MVPKIVELIIQDGDDEAGLDGIALVENPAHEASFEYFSDNEKPVHYVLADEEIPQILQMFNAYGEPQGLLEKEGFVISSIKSMGRQEFEIISNPNEPSSQDTNEVKFRYKYVGPRDDKNRTFCAEMMRENRVFRIEDIQEMSNRSVNPVGPDGYDMFEWRGSFNCRHRWVQLMYKLDTNIINKASVRKGVLDEDDVPGPDTLTTAALEAGYKPRTGFGKIKSMEKFNEDVSALPTYVDEVTKDVIKKPVLASLPMFENKSDAEALAEVMGCKGSHAHQYGDKTLYMPCEKHPEDMSFEKISIDYDDTLSTERGKELARQLIKDGATLYIISARNDKEGMLNTAKDLGVDASKVFATGSNKSKIEKIKELNISKHIDNNPDVIKELGTIGEKFDMTDNSGETTFSVFNAEERMVVGPAMIPDKMIIRRNEITGEIYYVYFTAETIKKLQQKFMQEKLLDKTNIEHGRKFLTGVDVVESWIVEDPKFDKEQVYGMDYPKGTWMVAVKIKDDNTWSQVKDGKLKGFSVQGYFLEKAKFSSINNELIDEIKQILNKVK